MSKPTVFNYNDYIQVKEERDRLLEENWKLKERVANLLIRCRIAEEDLQELQRGMLKGMLNEKREC